jgi:hypothetical protein
MNFITYRHSVAKNFKKRIKDNYTKDEKYN